MSAAPSTSDSHSSRSTLNDIEPCGPPVVSMVEAYRSLLAHVGEDPARDGLRDTPARAAAALRFLTGGYALSVKDVLNGALFDAPDNDLVSVGGIEVFSLCEHHVLPFYGECAVAYVPAGRVIGLSKLARIVDVYARRLQSQEALTRQIADGIREVSGASGVGVIMTTRHMCMAMRGVEKRTARMTTSVMLGELRECDALRQQFVSFAGNSACRGGGS